MESLIVIVGFLGAGKTTLLRKLIECALEGGWSPFVILNDYGDASLEASQLSEFLSPNSVSPLSGSCICCDGIPQLRQAINRIPERANGVTFIEVNGTSDAVRLLGFLGVGIHKRFAPPIQISLVDAKNWQCRGEQNELESHQIQVASLLVLSHLDRVGADRQRQVSEEIKAQNPHAPIVVKEEVDHNLLVELAPNNSVPAPFNHQRTHWASCSIDLPILPSLECAREICRQIDSQILRVKGCAQIGQKGSFTFFERFANDEISTRPYRGSPRMGSKLLVVGPGSDPQRLQHLVDRIVKAHH